MQNKVGAEDHTMPSSIEHFPVELWLMIFTFIEGNDLQKAFSNLNSYFTELLDSPQLRITMNVTTGGCKVFSTFRSTFRPEAFEALHANFSGTTDLLVSLNNTDTLSNLRSLTLHIRQQKNYHLLLSLLPKQPRLQHLAISCGMHHVGSAAEPLLREILKLPQLQTCELRLSRNPFNLPKFNSNLPISNSLRHFQLNTSIPSASLCHLVRFMPSLRILNVHLYRHDGEEWNCLSLSQMTERACRSFIASHLYLEDLAEAAPNLIYLYTNIEPYNKSSYEILSKGYKLDGPKVNDVHLRMTWKRNSISDVFHIMSPVIIQGQKCLEDKWIVGQYAHQYTSFKMYSTVL